MRMKTSALVSPLLRRMTKVHPNSSPSTAAAPSPPPSPSTDKSEEVVMTVWRKSLLFNCRGFTVFDSAGDLVFRVDSYSTSGGGGGSGGRNREIVLMDATGVPLFTIRRKSLSLGEKWLVYEGEETYNGPRFSVAKNVTVRQSKELAHVTRCAAAGKPSSVTYSVEGSYVKRCSMVYDEGRRVVAEVQRKEAAVPEATLGGDVFRLVLQPGLIDAPLAMAIVVLLDQMFGSS